MSQVEHSSIKTDDQYHHYTSNTIPWFVRLMWVGFWVFTVVYTIRFLFPAIQVELFTK